MTNPKLLQIDNWLKLNANKISEFSLNEPATEDEIEEMEELIGKSLPSDFKELYSWHNGLSDDDNCGSLFFGMDFFSISRILLEYKQNIQHEKSPLSKCDKEIDNSDILNSNWIKFAFDGAHTALLLDLQPTIEGKYGQIIFVDGEYETAILVANSTSDFISDFLKDLENNLYHLHPDALEDDNHFLETDKTIDIVNWKSSTKWRR